MDKKREGSCMTTFSSLLRSPPPLSVSRSFCSSAAYLQDTFSAYAHNAVSPLALHLAHANLQDGLSLSWGASHLPLLYFSLFFEHQAHNADSPLALHLAHADLKDGLLLGGQATLHIALHTAQQEGAQHLCEKKGRRKKVREEPYYFFFFFFPRSITLYTAQQERVQHL